jgi:Ca2+-binding RTX toxin-like protein
MANPVVYPKFTTYDVDPGSNIDWTNDAIVLRNGNLLIVADELGSTGDVSMRQFEIDGTSAGANQNVNTTTFDGQKDAKVVQLKNGNIVVVWTDESATAPDFSGETVRMQIFTAAGVKIGGEITVPVVTNDNQRVESIMALADGRFAVFWEDESLSSSSPSTKFRIYNADGTPSSGEKLLPENFFLSESQGSTAATGAGGLIAAGIAVAAFGPFTEGVAVQRFTKNGGLSGDTIVLTGNGNYSDAKIERLENGNFAVTWTNESLTPPFNKGPYIQGQIITSAGDKIGGIFTVSEDIFSEHRNSQITALDDGRFAVTWRSNPDNDTIGYRFQVRVFNADGTADGDLVTVYDNSVANDGIRNFADLRSVEELPDGRLIFTFRALTPEGNPIAATRIVDPRDALDIRLGDSADTFAGTRFDDQIDGRGGNDSISGMNGDDVIKGGDGGDILTGDNGNDTLFGGAGRDRLTGGDDADILRGGADDGVGDQFIFLRVSDSGTTVSERDSIFDFVSGIDKINLSAIDANASKADDQAFKFSSTAAANSVWLADTGTDIVIRGDVNGDGVADFSIRVVAVNQVIATDFVL